MENEFIYLKKATKLQIISSSIMFAFSLIATIAVVLIAIYKTEAIENLKLEIIFKCVLPIIISSVLLFVGIKINKLIKVNNFEKIKSLIITSIVFLSVGLISPFLLFNAEIRVAKILSIAIVIMFIICIVYFSKGLKELK